MKKILTNGKIERLGKKNCESIGESGMTMRLTSMITSIFIALLFLSQANAVEWTREVGSDSPGVFITGESPEGWFSPTAYSIESPASISLDNMEYDSVERLIEYNASGTGNGHPIETHVYGAVYNGLQVTSFEEDRKYPESGNEYHIVVSNVMYDSVGNVLDGYDVTVIKTNGGGGDGNPLSDDFDDNTRGGLWGLYQHDPDNCWVEETNQRLEVRATGASDGEEAYYVPGEWGIDATEDFQMKIDFFYSAISSSQSGVFLLIGCDTALHDHDDNYVALVAASGQGYWVFWYEVVVDNAITESGWRSRTSNNGVLYISYDAALDELYLSSTGYGSANAWKTVSGVLQSQWDCERCVGVGIGGKSGDVAITSGEAHLDNFVIERAKIVHPADTDSNYVISMLEILGYIDEWAVGNVSMLEVLEGIDLWAEGHYYWDESEQKFKPGVEP